MADRRPFGLLDFLLFLLVLVVAGGVRAGYLYFGADQARQSAPVLVQGEAPAERTALVGNLKEHNWFGSLAPFAAAEEPTAHVAPGYPWLLGLLAKAPLDLDPTARWVQCGLGTLTAGLYFLFARRSFQSLLVGLLAGLLGAVYPFWVVNTAELNDGVLATFLLAACLFLGGRAGSVGGPFTSLLYGLALAGSTLVRAAWLPFAFAALLWFLLRCRTMPRGWLLALLAFLGFANGLAPWTLRNWQRFQDVVPITDAMYLHLWMGNNPLATGGPQTEDTLLQALAQQRGQSATEAAGQLEKLPQNERYRSLAGAVVQEVRHNPVGTLQRRLQAGLDFLLGESWFQEQRLWQPGTTPASLTATSAEGATEGSETPAPWTPPRWLLDGYPGALIGSLLALLLLALLGWRWTYAWRRGSMPAALAVIWIPLPYLLSHAESLSGPRLPLDGVFLCYAAFALACIVPGLSSYLLAGVDDEP